jgi:hypothetical protein
VVAGKWQGSQLGREALKTYGSHWGCTTSEVVVEDWKKMGWAREKG